MKKIIVAAFVLAVATLASSVHAVELRALGDAEIENGQDIDVQWVLNNHRDAVRVRAFITPSNQSSMDPADQDVRSVDFALPAGAAYDAGSKCLYLNGVRIGHRSGNNISIENGYKLTWSTGPGKSGNGFDYDTVRVLHVYLTR